MPRRRRQRRMRAAHGGGGLERDRSGGRRGGGGHAREVRKERWEVSSSAVVENGVVEESVDLGGLTIPDLMMGFLLLLLEMGE
ncbi:unnamed protein product [Linum trigynum]|uniref:Uncharacterized protein n=1 Tax=Linum trigynum TaxID=586398 RepID=A0AAV2DAC4_9ROSI